MPRRVCMRTRFGLREAAPHHTGVGQHRADWRAWACSGACVRPAPAPQDTETGGFSDRPGDVVDPFHTLFGTAALSLMGDTRLNDINPIFCMAENVVQRAVTPAHLTNVNR